LLAGRGADVVHTHSAKAGTLGRLAAHRVRVPRIVHTYHGFPFHEFQSPGRRAAYIGIERRLGRITDVGLCVGTAVAVEAARRGLIAPQRIRTIGVAVDEHAPVRTAATRAAARARLGLPADATIVGCVGRLAYQKAPEHFVSALDQLGRPDVIGVWIGSGELAARMERAVAAAAPRARIVLAGERTDVPELLPALDVFALPSRYEGLPVAVVEAMSCGIPVVATAVNAVGDAVVPGRTGLLIPPERPDVLAAAIGYLIDHAAAAEELAMNARAHLLGRHSDAVLAAELDRAYRPARSDGTSHITGRASTDHAVTGPYHNQSMEEPECM
jgi:glycosyltransferase involved in cell wall biosynthesis